jgi:RTX calcium-binding nonapeptide repeat (4 copies)
MSQARQSSPRSWCIALLSLTAVLASAGPAIGSAAATPLATCSNVEAGAPGPEGDTLEVSAPPSIDLDVELRRDGEQILVLDHFLGGSRVITCDGQAPTVTNIDSIRVTAPASNVAPHLTLNLSGGLLAPGATPEGQGDSEIEISTAPPGRGPFAGPFDVDIDGQSGPDDIVVRAQKGAKGSTDLAAELNASEQPSDPDLIVEDGENGDMVISAGQGPDRVAIPADRFGEVTPFVDLRGQGGDDVLTNGFESSGGPGDDLIKGSGTGEKLRGGPGRDRLFGNGGSDRIKGGGGRDEMFGGTNPDDIAAAGGGRDRVWCGPGPGDDVKADRLDRLHGCERISR